MTVHFAGIINVIHKQGGRLISHNFLAILLSFAKIAKISTRKDFTLRYLKRQGLVADRQSLRIDHSSQAAQEHNPRDLAHMPWEVIKITRS